MPQHIPPLGRKPPPAKDIVDVNNLRAEVVDAGNDDWQVNVPHPDGSIIHVSGFASRDAAMTWLVKEFVVWLKEGIPPDA
jgi:hypothetical protein